MLDSDEETAKAGESSDSAEVTSDMDSDPADSSSDKEDADATDNDQRTPHQAVAYIIKVIQLTGVCILLQINTG